ncbi:MAG: CoA transferase [Candidatus Lambdaproteobacteria bacterium]|nr:CoA transferase [Candidatus Lambdaproteobacteria bacterium]
MTEGLAQLNVIELGGGVSAAMASKMLADLGATVVKIEPPEGDPARREGPFRNGKPDPEASGTFLYLNANKRSLVLDLTQPGGRAELERLVAQAHLLIHNVHPTRMAALGVDYARYSALNPRLVMLSLTPFGLSGPNRDLPASELTLFHAGGWGAMCPGKSTHPERPPLKAFGHHAEVQAALHGVSAALGALYGAAETGVGDQIDLSTQEAVAFLLGRNFAIYTYADTVYSRLSPAPYEPQSIYPCKDGMIYIICAEESQWQRLVELMGTPAWAVSGRFATRDLRGENREELKRRLGEWTAPWETEPLFHACQKARVGAAPVYDYVQMEAAEQLQSRRYIMRQRHAVAGEVRLPGAPYLLKQPWWALRRPAPLLGEANAEQERLFAAIPEAAPLAASKAAAARSPAAAQGTPPLPLTGVRVLDFSWVWAGPHCTLMLASLGAEVIKVESSARIDITRRTNPFVKGMPTGPNRSGYFNQLNQSKKSVGINLSSQAGKALVKALAARSDVMISNFGTGVLERLGIGPEEMAKVNPNLIQAMISAFGQTGPCALYMGYGPLVSPLGGLAAQTGYQGGEPEDLGIPYGDPNGGVYTALAITASLLARRMHGKGGQVIDMSMWEAMVASSYDGWMNHALGNPPYPRAGNRDPVHAPHNLYRCTGDDAWVAISATTPEQWRALCQVIGTPALAGDPRFRSESDRKAHEDELDALIGAWCGVRERWAAARTLLAAGVPAFPPLSTKDMDEDPHLNARGYFTRWPHPEVGARKLMRVPWLLTRRENGCGSYAPLMGEHTDQVLAELVGLSKPELARLRAEKVIE